MFPNLKETEIGFEQKTISRKEMFNRLIVSPIQRVLDLILSFHRKCLWV